MTRTVPGGDDPAAAELTGRSPDPVGRSDGPVDTADRLDPTVLAERLGNWADGLSFESDAVSLVITHGTWLRHHGFVSACVFLIEPDGAAIDWLMIPQLLARTTAEPLDAEILTLARQLAGRRHGAGPDRMTGGEATDRPRSSAE